MTTICKPLAAGENQASGDGAHDEGTRISRGAKRHERENTRRNANCDFAPAETRLTK